MFFLIKFAGGPILSPPYGTYPYAPAPQIIPTVTPLTPRAPAYYPPIFYWPYPSPPVSPTSYYAHTGPTLVIMRGLPYNATVADILTFFQSFREVSMLHAYWLHLLWTVVYCFHFCFAFTLFLSVP